MATGAHSFHDPFTRVHTRDVDLHYLKHSPEGVALPSSAACLAKLRPMQTILRPFWRNAAARATLAIVCVTVCSRGACTTAQCVCVFSCAVRRYVVLVDAHLPTA